MKPVSAIVLTTSTLLALCGVGFFAVYLAQIVRVVIRGPHVARPKLLAGALIAMFGVQIAYAALRTDALPVWALAVCCVGCTFGMAAGILVLWCNRAGKREET